MDRGLQEEKAKIDKEWAKLRQAKEELERDRKAFEDEKQDSGIEFKLFIGNLNPLTQEDGLRKYFEPYGVIKECVILTDKDGKSKRSGFIKFFSKKAADDAIAAHNERTIDAGMDIPLVVRLAQKKAPIAQGPPNPYALPASPYPGYPTPTPGYPSPTPGYPSPAPGFSSTPTPGYPPAPGYGGGPYSPAPSPASPSYRPPFPGSSPSPYPGSSPSPYPGSSPSPYPPNPYQQQPQSPYGAPGAQSPYQPYPPPPPPPRSSNGPPGKWKGPPGSNLYVNNLDRFITESDVKVMFSDFGNVISVKLFPEHGYGFVSYDSAQSAQAAIASLHGMGSSDGSKNLEVTLKKDTPSKKGTKEGGASTRFAPY